MDFIAPRTPIEQQVAQIWSLILNLASIGIQDDFFELGGNAVLATQVIEQLCETFSVKIPLDIFVESPTIGQLAFHIENLQWLNSQPQSPQLSLNIENLRWFKLQSRFEKAVNPLEEED